MQLTRRTFLGSGGGLAAFGFAGCTGNVGTNPMSGADAAYASFYTLYEFTRGVGGDALDVENAVPAGEHGHGWEPSASLLPEITETDAFVFLDVDGFQPWAEDAAEEIRSNYDEVALIDAVDGINLLEYNDHDHGSHDHSHDDHDNAEGHVHGQYDAKFFSDPILAQDGVENIRAGLSRVAPEEADTFVENANEYVERLTELHRQYSERLADRTHDTVVLAGHDSFQYLSERYGFEIHTPIGLSAHEEPSSGAIAETVEFVDSRGIDYVLWDYFDGERLAETIARNADRAVETAMVSPAESVAEPWLESGYGSYLGQMTEINLPAFERALGAR